MLEGIEYVALLHTKPAEMRALLKLEKAPRDGLFPILVVRPGAHHDMEKTWPIYAKAVGSYRFGFDIDRHKLGTTTSEPAKTQFDSLFSEVDGFRSFYDRAGQTEGAIPVFRPSINGVFENLDDQFDRIDELDRGLILRIERGFTQNWIDVLNHPRLHLDDALLVVDAGWSTDVLSLEMWSSQIIEQITDYAPEAEIVALSSCFPTSFSHIDDRGVFSIDDRDLYNRLVRRHNAANIKYGDWGSTRSSRDQGGGKPWPRIDIASTGDWTCFRQTKSEVGYVPVAARTVGDAIWPSIPSCWGKNTIQRTAMSIPDRITGTEIATSVRVNVHLTVQALGGTQPPLEETPYEDGF
jgi:Beta protein